MNIRKMKKLQKEFDIFLDALEQGSNMEDPSKN
jgi:hypothetical protein